MMRSAFATAAVLLGCTASATAPTHPETMPDAEAIGTSAPALMAGKPSPALPGRPPLLARARRSRRRTKPDPTGFDAARRQRAANKRRARRLRNVLDALNGGHGEGDRTRVVDALLAHARAQLASATPATLLAA